jgi:hypothetical protein
MREIDTSELDALARGFMAAPAKVIPSLLPVAHKAGGNIKATMKRDATGHRGLKSLPSFVEYDIEQTPTSVTVEVGFRKEGQGNLANFAAFGTPKQAPVMDITAGLYAELPNFMRWVVKVGSEIL